MMMNTCFDLLDHANVKLNNERDDCKENPLKKEKATRALLVLFCFVFQKPQGIFI